jgi:hypothetical protein
MQLSAKCSPQEPNVVTPAMTHCKYCLISTVTTHTTQNIYSDMHILNATIIHQTL